MHGSTSTYKKQYARRHPYLTGNFAPIHQTNPLTLCSYTGTIPRELQGGQYVRNGGNPLGQEDLGRSAHWFDGDGMLSGVFFRKKSSDGLVVPEFVNQYILTDIYLSHKSMSLSHPIVPSITTLIDPLSSAIKIILSIFRTLLLVLLSHLPGPQHNIKRISVANTSVLYHDGQALAACESGPLIRVQLPSLGTVGWYSDMQLGIRGQDHSGQSTHPPLKHNGRFSFIQEWTTGHPKVDPQSGEMLLYHNTFLPPYVRYSIVPAGENTTVDVPKLVNEPLPGVSGPKMMHDFGASHSHTVILDLPLTLDPINVLKNKQVVSYELTKPSRFGLFPRYKPLSVRWFTAQACCIFHTANTWDTCLGGKATSVNLLACRMTSATLIYSAGNIASPEIEGENGDLTPQSVNEAERLDNVEHDKCTCRYEEAICLESPASVQTESTCHNVTDDECRLYYYEFDLSSQKDEISHQWALSAIPFEFPSVRHDREMQEARYIYGCSTSSSCFGAALGRAVKIDVLAKVDANALIKKGKTMKLSHMQCVDNRTVAEILKEGDVADPIRLFRLPPNHYAQEPRFIPASSSVDEDDGYLLFYVFDESQLLPSGDCPGSSFSELWVLDARHMRHVVAKVKLPQRVPYGLHGTWFSSESIINQRRVTSLRSLKEIERTRQHWLNERGWVKRSWVLAIERLARAVS